MNSNPIRGTIELARPLNVLIAMASIAVAVLLAGGGTADIPSLLIACGVGGLVAAGANAINDAFDVAIDRVNRPDRPIPRGAVTDRGARLAWIAFSVCGILLNLFLHSAAFWIATAAVAALFAYSAYLKRTVLGGNILVAGMTGMAFIYGGVVAGNVKAAVIPAVFAFLINLAREVIKDVEDREGDARDGARTLPVRFGLGPSRVVATITLVGLITATILPYATGPYGSMYGILIIPVDGILVVVLVGVWREDTAARFRILSTLLKIAMVVGLAAIYFG
ncbi:MAG: geranylgeranylglycerol-phosphate geranylgeranyltransferase [Bacteroidota bacterium]